MDAFVDFIANCDWCGKYTEDLIEFYDKETGDDWYFCPDCMKKVRKIRREKRKAEADG